MSEKQLKAFREAVKSDTRLQEKLEAATGYDAAVTIANEAGFSVCIADFQASMGELSDEDLEAVTGGEGDASWGQWWKNVKDIFQ